jgi:predicted Rossmann fold nucleotide-binding protein DprA/Smf involved in DNA uptake
MSKGPARLLKDGAQLTESADDILSSLGLAKKEGLGEQ